MASKCSSSSRPPYQDKSEAPYLEEASVGICDLGKISHPEGSSDTNTKITAHHHTPGPEGHRAREEPNCLMWFDLPQ